MIRRSLTSIAAMFTGTMVVCLLYAFAPPEYGTGGFTRKTHGKISVDHVRTMKSDSYYFAGQTEQALVLGHLRQPLELLLLIDTSIIAHRIQCDSTIVAGKIHVVNDRFLLHDVYRNIAYRGNTNSFHIVQAYAVSSATVDLLLSRTTVIHRQQRYRQSRTLIFREDNPADTSAFIPERQLDGLFCTDGIVLTDARRNLVVYVYYYRNEIIVLDSTLNVITRHHTIDTVSRAHIQVSELEGSHTTFASPPTFVNRKAILAGNLLIVQSHIKSMGHGEPDKGYAFLDIYTLMTGAYLNTIYLPDFREQPVRDIYYYKGVLFALHGRYLVTYRIMDQ